MTRRRVRPCANSSSLARASSRMVALTGAGVSTESGIPDYRGPNGVWATGKIPTISDFLTNPQTRREYWEGRRTRYPELAAKVSNRGHLALAALQHAGRVGEIITQNIDGFAPEGGVTARVGHRAPRVGPPDQVPDLWARLAGGLHSRAAHGRGRGAEACEVCGGILARRNRTLRGITAQERAQAAAQAATNATCSWWLAARSSSIRPHRLPLLAQRAGAKLAIVNHTPTGLDSRADVVVRMDAGPALAVLSLNLLRYAIV